MVNYGHANQVNIRLNKISLLAHKLTQLVKRVNRLIPWVTSLEVFEAGNHPNSHTSFGRGKMT